MDVNKLTIYQKTVLFHFTYIESKLFRNRIVLIFLSGLILALVAAISKQWYLEGVIPSIETAIVIIVSIGASLSIVSVNKQLSSAYIFLIEMHTRIFMILKMFKDIESDDSNGDYKSMLNSEMNLIETEFKKRFKHTVR